MEAYMAPGDRRERSTPSGTGGDAAYHLLLLAQNLEGYQNLLKLSSSAYREGFYYKPRIDKAILQEFNKGLIATSACLGGEIPSAFMKRDGKDAQEDRRDLPGDFRPRPLFHRGAEAGNRRAGHGQPRAGGAGANGWACGLVATNDVHFLTKEDHYAHDVLCCISMGRLVSR